jgi:hypothetical protein
MKPIDLAASAKKRGSVTWKHGGTTHGLLQIFDPEDHSDNPLFVLDVTGPAQIGFVPDRRFYASEVVDFRPDE